MWCCEWEDVKPDMLVTSKALGGGIPLSAVVARADCLEAWGPGAHVSTQAGNVLACAAGNKVLEKLTEPGFLEGVTKRGERLIAGWRELQTRHPMIGHIDGRGIYVGIELVKDQETREPAADEATFILRECVREGLIFEKGGYFHNRFQLIPPLTIRDESIDRVLEIFDAALGRAETEFGRT